MSALRPTTLTIAALGGQGGGVVTDWLVTTARHAGYLAQATSVPGVAQRTGATIYYLEFFPRASLRSDGREPVMALMPNPGDVDIVVASELVEAGRAMNRGLVTPDRTTLIASTHRDYTISEKSALGDGRASNKELLAAAAASSARLVSFDMAAVAERAGGRISAVIFGAIAGSGVLAWDVQHFQAAIRESGIGVEANLKAFEAGRSAASQPGAAVTGMAAPVADPAPGALSARIANGYPANLHDLLTRAVVRLVDYQDARHAGLYLDWVAGMLEREPKGAGAARLTEAVARSLALWMSFEDVMRVAQVKTRAGRFEQIRAEVRAAPTDLVRVTEFVSPRVEEICGTLPAGLGRYLEASPRATRFLSRFTRGRRISTSSIGGFLLLRILAALRRMRRGTLRHAVENARIEQWLGQIRGLVARDYDMAVEVAECQNLVKGYGSTHERGWHSFVEICARAEVLAGTPEGPARVRRLREAALADDTGAKLAAVITELGLA